MLSRRAALVPLLLAGLLGAACDDEPSAPAQPAADVGDASDTSDIDAPDDAAGDAPLDDVATDAPLPDAAEDAPAEGPRWESAPAITAGPRQEIAVVAFREEVWVIGGFDEGGRYVGSVEIYNTTTGLWRSGPELPAQVHHANAAVVGDRVYVVGYLVGGFAEEGRIFETNAAADGWIERDPMPLTLQRGSSGVGVVRDRIVLVGGLRNVRAVPDVTVWSPQSGAFEDLPPLPVGLDHMAAAVIDDVLYVAGGRTGQIDSHYATTLALAPDAAAWRTLASMPTSRAGTAGVALDGIFYVFGGEGNPDEPSGVFPQVEAYDPGQDAWTVLPPMPTPRHGLGAAAIGGRIYLPGGGDVRAFAQVDTHEIFIPD